MYKSKLQMLCQGNSWDLPEFSTSKCGPDHNPIFSSTVTVNALAFNTTDQSRTSKEAQSKAAKIAFDYFSSLNSYPKPFPNFPQPSLVEDLPISPFATSADMCRLYKNRLQNYVQKRNLPLPEYSSEREGPSHASRFRSKVVIDGKTYGSPDFFLTIKEAEYAAAKIALESLSVNDVQEDDSVLYKNLLQELTQKKGLGIPKYETNTSGPSHMRTFVSAVEIEGESFEGQAAKSKKQAETNAAMIAYTGLKEHKESLASVGHEAKFSSNTTTTNPGVHNHQAPPPSLDTDINTKRLRSCTSAVNKYAGPFHCTTSSLPQNGEHSESFRYSTLDSKANVMNAFPREKTFVYPRVPNMQFPDGATVLSFSDDKWVAVKMNSNQ